MPRAILDAAQKKATLPAQVLVIAAQMMRGAGCGKGSRGGRRKDKWAVYVPPAAVGGGAFASAAAAATAAAAAAAAMTKTGKSSQSSTSRARTVYTPSAIRKVSTK